MTTIHPTRRLYGWNVEEEARPDGMWGVVVPRQPRDGSTSCGIGCNCDLDYQQAGESVHVYWKLGSSKKSCDDCQRLATSWSPLVLTPRANDATAE